MKKRGLSTVVSTIILVLLVIAAVGGLWAVISNLLNEGASSISLGSLSVDLVIRSATINTTTGIASVKVARNPGISDVEITAIKFIVEDSRNAEVFEIQVGSFPEYAQRTFELNLSESEFININDIQRISLAAVYLSGDGTIKTSAISSGSYAIGDSSNIQEDSTVECVANADCGTDTWVEGTKICSSDPHVILQYKQIYECVSGFCQNSVEALPVESCLETEECYAGTCQAQDIPCTPETVEEDCGVDGFVGFPTCYSNPPPEKIVQDYQIFSCEDSACSVSVISELISECVEEQVCGIIQGQPECFTPVECTINEDCPIGEVCVDGKCEAEEAVITGTITSIWPFTLGEYFDSSDLPNTLSSVNYQGYSIIFPESAESRCLKISEYVYPDSPEDHAYVRLNESETAIKSDDFFEIWETEYGCMTL